MILPRLATALLGVPLVLYVIGLGSAPFLALSAALCALALREYADMLWAGGRGVQRTAVTLGGTLLCLAVGLSSSAQGPGVSLSHWAASALVALALLREMFRGERSLERAALTVLGAFFIAWPLGHLPLLRELPGEGRALTFLLFAGVWAVDTAAYAAGSLAGRHPLAPTLSPKKTWEGAAAGLAAALACALAAKGLAPEVFGLRRALVLGLLIGTLGQLSDLAQSLIKRACGVKDSSGLLPGHGGVFDRMDSFLLLAPAYYYAALLVR